MRPPTSCTCMRSRRNCGAVWPARAGPRSQTPVSLSSPSGRTSTSAAGRRKTSSRIDADGRPASMALAPALTVPRVDGSWWCNHIRPVPFTTAATDMSPDQTAPAAASAPADAAAADDLEAARHVLRLEAEGVTAVADGLDGRFTEALDQIGRASCRARVCPYV